jgi:hypothetical protein
MAYGSRWAIERDRRESGPHMPRLGAGTGMVQRNRISPGQRALSVIAAARALCDCREFLRKDISASAAAPEGAEDLRCRVIADGA